MRVYDIFGNDRLACLCIYDDGRKEWTRFDLGNLIVSDDVKTGIEQAVESHPNDDTLTFSQYGLTIRKRTA